jgi:glycosyltransferase involved in cell wall biosynthesis
MNTKMRPVVHIIQSLEIGGAELQLLELVKLQVKARKVSILVFTESKDLLKEFKSIGVSVSKMPKGVLAKFRTINAYSKSGALIHAHLPLAELFCSLMLRNSSRFIVTRHLAGKYSRKLPEALGNLLLNLVFSRAKAIIAISNTVKSDCVQRAFAKKSLEKKTRVIYYGFDWDYWERDLDSINYEVIGKKKEIQIGTIARLEEQKNLDALISALNKVRFINYKLWIVGDGSQREKLQDQTIQLGLTDKVIFCGKIRDTRGFLDGLDLFVLPTLYEGYGIVLIEAAARGIPIITSDLPICHEVLGDDSAIFFDPKDVEGISQKISLAITAESPAIRVKNARRRIREFGLDNLISATNSLYDTFEKV